MRTDSEQLNRLRAICLALPEATERSGVSEAMFQVRGKSFALFMDNHHGDDRVAAWCKAPPGVQDVLISVDPARYFVPPYVGHHGWIGVQLGGDEADWGEIADLIADCYRQVAPKRLLAAMGGTG